MSQSEDLLRQALIGVHAVAGKRAFFVAIGLGPGQGVITGGNTSPESQCEMLRSVLESFEQQHARTILSELRSAERLAALSADDLRVLRAAVELADTPASLAHGTAEAHALRARAFALIDRGLAAIGATL